MSRLTGVLLVLMFVLLLGITYYQGKVTKLTRDVDDITKVANQQKTTIDLMATNQKLAEALDTKYTKELANAKFENDLLRADVESGVKRLHINATCKRLPQATGTSSVDDAASPGLTESAQRDYLNLRERIGTATKQIAGLQEYIRNICTK